MKKSNDALRLAGAYALYFVLAAAPVAVAVALDWDVYTADPRRCWSLSVAGVAAAVLIAFQALGHSPKKVKRVVWYALAAGVLWLLKPLVDSLAVLVTCMAVGEGLATIVANPILTHIKRARDDCRLSTAVAEAVKEASGRV